MNVKLNMHCAGPECRSPDNCLERLAPVHYQNIRTTDDETTTTP